MKRVKEFHIKQTELPIEELNKVYETKGVFSDHYIKTKLKTSRLWPTENEVKPFFDYCVGLWDKMSTALGKRDEEFTEQELLEKILPKLGFAHLRKQSLPTTEGRKEPDYLLFDSEQVKDTVITRSKAEQYAVAISVLEAKKVNHRLDAVSKKETPGRFPHQQIRDYLQEATDNQGKPYFNWAILTNGNMWRLYCRNARPSDYFEFNFEKSLDSLEDFIIFATLFRSQSFVKNSEGRCSLDDLRDEALQFQTKLEDDLRKRVFNILENLANGFYKRPENKITKDNLNELYQNCLIFLYRLLFILYAEGRGLLPVKPYGVGSNKNYRERYSLQRLIPRLKNYQEYTSEELIDLYEEILRLFHLINGDKSSVNQECNVPLYNGRLFDTDKFPKIDQWRIGEKTLGDVIRGLIFTPVPERTEEQKTFSFGDTIDYADLEVRQLGSIYEGLLENHLEIKDSGLKLVGDKAERKATGTYYTPDYIVQYIVENTIGPLCDEIEKIPVIQKAIVESRKDDSFANTVLKLNILDPAMGSGHFLVRATEYLADKILSHPTTSLHIEVISPGLSHERAEIAYWRRRVVESCIYGVDLNSLAVELAKLSLWLTCISPDKPLSFLDHHLRIGNSLIGAVLSELSDLPSKKKTSQLPLLFGPDLPIAIHEAIRGIHNIEETESKDIAIIKDKESKWYNEVIPQLEPYRTIADLWTSTFFGSSINKNEYLQISKLLLSKPAPKTKQAKELREYLLKYKDTIEIAKAKKFFHWELQFPEVFFNENGLPKENPGFDVIVGNPPYLPTEEIDPEDSQYYQNFYNNILFRKYDSSILFIYLGLKLNRPLGYCGMITPIVWETGENYYKFRTVVLRNFSLKSIINLPFDIFPDAYIDTCISIFNKTNPSLSKQQYVSIKQYGKKERISVDDDLLKNAQLIDVNEMLSNKDIKILSSSNIYNLIKKLESVEYTTLGNLTDSCQGIVESFYTYSDTQNTPNQLPYIVGQVYRYKFFIDSMKFINFSKAKSLWEYYTNPRILMRRIVSRGNRIMGTIVKDAFVCKKDLNPFIIKDKQYSLQYILACLNSVLFSFLYMNISALAAKDDFRQTTIQELRKLPLRRINFNTSSNRRLEQVEWAKNIYYKYLETRETKLFDVMFKNLMDNPKESDVIHDFLAFLAEQMIEMNKEMQILGARFQSWLEKEIIKGSIEILKNKSKIKEFYVRNLESLVDILKQNRILPKTIGFADDRSEKIETAFNETMAKLNPLIDRISRTDKFIDQIVYNLYGLTKEEIDIIRYEFKEI